MRAASHYFARQSAILAIIFTVSAVAGEVPASSPQEESKRVLLSKTWEAHVWGPHGGGRHGSPDRVIGTEDCAPIQLSMESRLLFWKLPLILSIIFCIRNGQRSE